MGVYVCAHVCVCRHKWMSIIVFYLSKYKNTFTFFFLFKNPSLFSKEHKKIHIDHIQ
jgi:hypothetical protein